jgi:LysM repeat protein
VGWWKTSQIHNDTMLASTYVEIGCGVATDGNNRYYYVCLTGYIAGGAYTPSSGSSSSSSSAQPAAPVMIPVTKADPQPDGSIVHIIRTGQTLWTLAAVYEVPLAQILQLNNFSEWQIIQPGDEVIVAPAGSAPTVQPTEDAEATPEATETDEPTPTAAASNTPRPTAQQLAQAEPTQDQLAAAPSITSEEAQQQNSTVTLVVGIALFSIVGVIVASFFIQKPPAAQPPSDNDPFAPIS